MREIEPQQQQQQQEELIHNSRAESRLYFNLFGFTSQMSNHYRDCDLDIKCCVCVCVFEPRSLLELTDSKIAFFTHESLASTTNDHLSLTLSSSRSLAGCSTRESESKNQINGIGMQRRNDFIKGRLQQELMINCDVCASIPKWHSLPLSEILSRSLVMPFVISSSFGHF
jgi:hypothetical protein